MAEAAARDEGDLGGRRRGRGWRRTAGACEEESPSHRARGSSTELQTQSMATRGRDWAARAWRSRRRTG
jgi:hypothetical protein